MSGPKLSEAEIKRLRMIEEERRKLYQKIVRKKEELKRILKEASDVQSMTVSIYSMEEIRQKSGQLSELQNGINESLAQIEEALKSENNDLMKKVLKRLSGHEKDLETVHEVRTFVSRVREKFIEEQFQKIKEENAKEAENVKESGGMSYSEYVKGIIPDEFLDAEKARISVLLENLEIRTEALEILKKREDRGKLGSDLAKIREKINALLQDINRDNFSMFEELHRLDVSLLRPFRDQIEKEEEEADRLDGALSEELAKYHMLCEQAGEKPKRFAFAWESVEEIRYESARLIREDKGDKQIRALMKNIRKSLAEQGYTYLGEKEESVDFIREIYRVHDNVILHVIYASDGKVTMEVAMEDDKDRLPQPREVEEQVKEQILFCDAYERIFDAINEKGIGLRDEERLPVSADFAQIINTSGFCKTEEEDHYYDIYADRTRKYLYEE